MSANKVYNTWIHEYTNTYFYKGVYIVEEKYFVQPCTYNLKAILFHKWEIYIFFFSFFKSKVDPLFVKYDCSKFAYTRLYIAKLIAETFLRHFQHLSPIAVFNTKQKKVPVYEQAK